ncbi:MAG: hypothetical protein R3B36_36450 [Polyangiaceae bacterium]
MIPAIDLDHEPHRGRREVDDAATDDDLPPKHDAELPAAQRAHTGALAFAVGA